MRFDFRELQTAKEFVMSKFRGLLAGALASLLLSSVALADPIKITVSQYSDPGFTALVASYTADAYGNDNSTSPFSNSNTPGGSDPFAGTSVSWNLTTTADVPGEPNNAFLTSSTFEASNSSTTTYFLKIQVDAGTYTLPTTDRVGQASYSATLKNSTAEGTALFNGITLVDATHSQSGPFQAGFSNTGLPTLLPDGSYHLYDTYEVTLAGSTAGSSATLGLRTDIIGTSSTVPTPEPWNIVSAFATFIPVGLLYFGLRRRKGMCEQVA
jgi:hypothetical protein